MNQQITIEHIHIDDEANSILALHEKMRDAFTLGIQVECSPEEAEYSGAFSEDALAEDDACLSTLDLHDVLTYEMKE